MEEFNIRESVVSQALRTHLLYAGRKLSSTPGALASLLCLFGLLSSTNLWALAATNTTLTASPDTTLTAGQLLTLTAQVSSGGASITGGTVLFCNASAKYCEDAAILARAQVTAAGSAVTYLRLGAGDYTIKAVYQGTNSYAASTSATLSLTVTGAKQTPTLSLSAANTESGYSLTATMSASGPASPSGNLNFVDTTTSSTISSAALTAGTPAIAAASSNSYSAGTQSSLPADVIANGDFNHDGYMDAVVAAAGTNKISVLLGKGDGTFQTAVSYTTTNAAYGVVVADVNNDGNPDILVAEYGATGYLSVFPGKGDGTFGAETLYSAGAYSYSVAVGDFNGDGYLDAVVSDGGSLGSGNNLHILLNKGDGTFTDSEDYSSGAYWPRSVSVADMNGDGKLDLIATNYGLGAISTVSILLGNGDGTFGAATQYGTTSSSSYATAYSGVVADFNGDGYPDYASANYGNNTIGVLLNKGDGTGALQTYVDYTANSAPHKVIAIDLDGDGAMDLVASSMLGFQLLRGNGDGTFGASTTYSGGFFNSSLSAADLNGDGVPDLMTTSYLFGSMYAVTIKKSYVSTASINDYTPSGSGIHLVDAEYPGDSNYNNAASSTVSLNADLVVTTATVMASPASGVQAGMPVTLTATVSPATVGALVASGTVTFTEGATVLGTGTISNGQATLSVSSLAVGDHTITATYSGDTNFRGSVSSSITFSIIADVLTPTMSVSPSLAVSAGAAVTLTTTAVYGPTQVTGGSVNYCLSSYKLCQGAGLLASAGVSTYGTNVGKAATVVRLPAGSYSVYAQFIGSSAYGYGVKNTDPQTLVVSNATPAATTLSMTSAGAAGDYTLNGVLASGGATAPSGTISFLDTSNANGVLNSAALDEATVSASTQLSSLASYSGATTPNSIIYADLNNDGIMDMIVSSYGDGTIKAYLGNGDGTFQAAKSTTVGTGPTVMVAGDFDSNGTIDLAVSNITSGNTKILAGNGNGTFSTSWTDSLAPTAMAVGDLDHDGFPELAMISGSTLYIYSGNVYGQYASSTSYTLNGTAAGLLMGDFNGDGYLDVAVLTSGTPGAVNLYLNAADNTGALLTPVAYTAGNTPVAMTSGDFDGNGTLDLAVLNQGDLTVQIFSGNGDGTLTAKTAYSTAPSGATGAVPYAVATRDFNADGKLDLVVADSGTGTVNLLSGDGTGSFGTATAYTTGLSSLSGLAVADLNADGIPDVTVASTTANTQTVLLGALSRTQTVTLTHVAQPGTGTHAVEASYNGDGNYAGATSATVALTASVVPTTLSFSVSATQVQYGQPLTINASLTPATIDGYVPSGNLTFTDNSATLASVAMSSAAASTSTSTLTTGAHALSASYAGDAYFKEATTASSNVQVVSATTTITASAVSTTYGAAASSTVKIAGSYTDAGLALPSGTLTATLNGTQIGTATVTGGAATVAIPATITAGTYTLSLSYGGDTNYASSTGTATVTVAQARPVITWATPSAITYGTALSAMQLNAAATGVDGAALDGVFTYTPALSAVLSAGTQTLSVRFDPTDTTNYVSTTATVTIEVDKGKPALTWATPTAISYGTPLSATQLNATAPVDGTFSYLPGVGRVLGAGTQVLTASFTPKDTANYQSNSAQVNLTVSPAALVVVANAATRTYGVANPSFTGAISGVVDADILTETYTTTATATSVPGAYAIVPGVSGPTAANYSVTATNGVLTITKAASSTGLTSSSATTMSGATLTLVATVASSTTGVPTGTVSFYDGTTLVGTATLDATGKASYNADTLTGGTHSLTAAYAGDANFKESSSAAVSESVQDFSIGTSSSSGTSGSSTPAVTIASGGTASYSFPISPLNGSFTNTVTFSVSGLPSTMSYSFSPSSVTPGATVSTVTLTISNSKTQAMNKLRGGTALALGLLLLPLASMRRVRRRLSRVAWVLLLAAISASAALSLSACGGSSKAESYPLTVTATSGAVSHSFTLTLTVK